MTRVRRKGRMGRFRLRAGPWGQASVLESIVVLWRARCWVFWGFWGIDSRIDRT